MARNKFTRIVYILHQKVHIYDAGDDIMTKIMMRIRRVSLIRLPGKGIPGPRFPWDSQSLSPIHPNINIVNIVIIIIIAIHPNIIAIIIRPRPISVNSILLFHIRLLSKALCLCSFSPSLLKFEIEEHLSTSAAGG